MTKLFFQLRGAYFEVANTPTQAAGMERQETNLLPRGGYLVARREEVYYYGPLQEASFKAPK